MSTTVTRTGVVVDANGLTLLDTRELPWEPLPGIPGAKQKVLVRDAEGRARVQFTWLPPGLALDRPERHFHKTAHERGYVLFGELPMREYASADDDRGRPVVFREGYFMDRLPGSIHGLDPDLSSAVGFLMLEWRTAPGTYRLEEGASEQNVTLPAAREIDTESPLVQPGSPPWMVVDSGNLRLIDTRAMPWQALDGMTGAVHQPLAVAPEGHTEVVVVHLFPRPTGTEHKRHFHRTVHEWGYVLEGDLPMREYASLEDEVGQRVHFRKGYFMDRRPGSWHGVDTTRSSATGFTFLEWRTGPGTYVREAGAEVETPVTSAAPPLD